MKIEIRSWDTRDILFDGDYPNVADAVKTALRYGVSLAHADLSGVNFSGQNFSCARLLGVNFSGANLSGASFTHAYLHGSTFTDANLSGGDFYGIDAKSSNFSRANMLRANFARSALSRSDFTDANFSRAHFAGACFLGSCLSTAKLYRATLSRIDLSNTDLYAHAQVSFKAHGEMSRDLIAIMQKEGDEPKLFCGCFYGTFDSLEKYIAKGKEEYRRTRTIAMNTVKELLYVKSN